MQPPSENQRSSLQSLTRLGQELAGTLAVDTAVQRVVALVDDVLRPDHALIVLHHPDTDIPFVAYQSQYAKPRPDDPLVALVISDGPRVITGVGDDSFAARSISPQVSAQSWIASPVISRGKPIGAISLSSEEPGRYSEWQLDFLSTVTAQLGIALESIRLLQLLSIGKLEWEQTVDALSQAFCLVDRHGRIRRVNRAFATLVNLPLTALGGQLWRDVLEPAWAPAIYQAIKAAGSDRQFEIKVGTAIYTLGALPLGQPVGTTVLIFDDQTEKRRLQEQLIQSEKMSAIGQLIAGVAHDLNNPLASVVGFADFLIEGAAAPESLREPLEVIRNEAERAAKIVRSLLNFARKNEGERRLQPIGPILEETVMLLRNQLSALKIETSLKVADDIPQIAIDANQLQQVFINLVTNAAQAMDAAGAGDRVDIVAKKWMDGVAIHIADNGPGVPEEIAAHVFEPFFTTKPEGEGTGLGLSICQGIVKEHGGHISLEPRPDGGAEFTVQLPGSAVATEEKTPATVELGHLKILVVDDEPHIQHYMRAALEAWGHSVQTASDGSEALTIVNSSTFDVIVTDLRMPTQGGREFYAELCEQDPDAARRVVFATGDTVRGDTMQFLESQGQPFLRKPFTLDELRDALARVAR